MPVRGEARKERPAPESVRENRVNHRWWVCFTAALILQLRDEHRLSLHGYFIVFLGYLRQVPQNRLMNDLWNTILGFDVDPVEPQ